MIINNKLGLTKRKIDKNKRKITIFCFWVDRKVLKLIIKDNLQANS